MDTYDFSKFKSRKEINKIITKLKCYYVYGAENEFEKGLVIIKLNELRTYKNLHFPKKSLLDLFKR